MNLSYGQAQDEDLPFILELQKQNHKNAVDDATKQSQGFVTAEHDLNLLKAMNDAFPHTVAYDGKEVIGYALTMTKAFRNKIEILKPMFDMIDQTLAEKQMSDRYVVMGQVCIKASHRGQGIFYKLYDAMKRFTQGHFDSIITEVSVQNKRSLKAHYNHGFESLKKYQDKFGEDWDLIIWELSD